MRALSLNNKLLKLGDKVLGIQEDIMFNIGSGFDGGIYGIVTSSDGKIYVAGAFTSYQGHPYNRIIRLNQDGSIDTSFNVGDGFNYATNVIYLQSDGKIIVGGWFTSYQGQMHSRIIRLNSDGSVDSYWGGGDVGIKSLVYSVCIQTSGKMIVTSSSSVPRAGVIRLNLDGSRDISWAGDVLYPVTRMIRASRIQQDGNVLLGGDFSDYMEHSSVGIVRVNQDGYFDPSFIVGSGFESEDDWFPGVFCMDIQGDGKILVGGDFISYQGHPYNRIIRLNSDGSIDTSFIVGSGFDDATRYIQVLPDGKILLVGDFTTYDGITYNRIIRLNQDGSVDTSFNPGLGFNDRTSALQMINGKIMVGGSFTTYNGSTYNKIIQLNNDGSSNTTTT